MPVDTLGSSDQDAHRGRNRAALAQEPNRLMKVDIAATAQHQHGIQATHSRFAMTCSLRSLVFACKEE